MKSDSINRYGSDATAARLGSFNRPWTTGHTAGATPGVEGCTTPEPSTDRSFVHAGLMITPTNGRRRPEERSP